MEYNFQEIQSKIDDIASNRSDLVGLFYGHKISNGEQTGELAIVHMVKEKKPVSELSPQEIIPSQIELAQGVIKTDVVQMGEVKALACNPTCGDPVGASSVANRAITRPIKGGLSITSENLIGYVGTMGLVAVHTATQALVGVTNNHVIIQDAFYTSQRNIAGVLENEYTPTDHVYQSGDGSLSVSSRVGIGLRYVPIFLNGNGTNNVDAAFFSLTQLDSAGNTVVNNSESFKQIGESYATPPPFATTLEIDNLLTTNPMLYSSGRSTGPKGGVGCPMRVLGLNGTYNIDYTLQGAPATALFNDSIVFVKPQNDPSLSTICVNPIFPGDSGSALLADFDGVRKIIGLVYAAAFEQGQVFYGIACRIDRVATQLGIEAWDGTPKNYINPNTIEYITVPGGSSTKVITCNSKDYWQVGLTSSSNPCI